MPTAEKGIYAGIKLNKITAIKKGASLAPFFIVNILSIITLTAFFAAAFH